jgi:hypothetical protein
MGIYYALEILLKNEFLPNMNFWEIKAFFGDFTEKLDLVR